MTTFRKATLGASTNGFTFVELLVVITIIAIIFASAAVAFTSVTLRSRDARRRSDLEVIRQSLEMCRSMVGYYPDLIYTASGISCSDTGPITLNRVPTDPRPSDVCLDEYDYVKSDPTSYTLTSCMETGGYYQVASP